MLNYTRPHTPAYWTVDLVDIIQNITSQITIPENISIEMNFEEPLPNLIADPIHMEVVFTNLISNAVQAMPDGGTLSIHGWHSEENGSQPGSISIAVSDTGVGIPPANMVKLFEPLFSTKISGIGLGLAISKILIETHAGRIDVESLPGEGSTFRVHLPTARPGLGRIQDLIPR